MPEKPPFAGNQGVLDGGDEEPITPKSGGLAALAGLCSPPAAEKKRWLLTQEQVAEKDTLHVQIPTTPVKHKASRVGDEFQATVPPVRGARPPSKVGNGLLDRRVGEPGPTEEEALKISSVKEREFAKSLPRDATVDMHMEPDLDSGRSGAAEVRLALLDRSQRVRRRPQWLNGQNLYGIRRKTRGEDNTSLAGEAMEEGAVKEEAVALGGLPRQPSMRGFRSKRSKGSASALNLQELDDESTLSDEPMMQHWVLAPDRSTLSVTVVVDGVTYSGQLEPARPHVPRGARRGRKPRRNPLLPPPPPMEDDSSPGASMDQDAYHHSDMDEEGGHQMTAYGGGKRPRRASSEDGRGGKKQQLEKDQPPIIHSERHQKAEERFRLLEEAGAPLDTLCSLCHLEENETVVYDHPEDGVEVRLPLGRLLLVRTSTITHAWVHFECGRWCPEVREVDADENEILEGIVLEGLPEAVRRGRRIKCTECGQKGATIGCFARGCRRSFHLQCACVAGCLIQEGTFESYCPEHAELYGEQGRSKRPSGSVGGDLESRRDGADGRGGISEAEGPHSSGGVGGARCDTGNEEEAADDAALAADILGALQRGAGDVSTLNPPKRPAAAPRSSGLGADQPPFKARTAGRAGGPSPRAMVLPEGGQTSVCEGGLMRKPAPAAAPAFRPPGAVPPAPVRSKKSARVEAVAGFCRQLSPAAPRPGPAPPANSFRPGAGLVSKNTFLHSTTGKVPTPGSSNSGENVSGPEDHGTDSQQGDSHEEAGARTPEKKPPAWLARAIQAAAAVASGRPADLP